MNRNSHAKFVDGSELEKAMQHPCIARDSLVGRLGFCREILTSLNEFGQYADFQLCIDAMKIHSALEEC